MSEAPRIADRDHVLRLLGAPVGDLRLGDPVRVESRDLGGMRVQQLTFAASHGETIPALFLPPTRRDSPAVLYCHAHGARYDIGLRELWEGRPALSAPWLADLAAMGAAVLCLEMPCFGARTSEEGALSKALLWRGRTLYGQMIAELWAGMDWLTAHPMIDARRIGTMGISMGGTHAWWLAALDPRYACAVSLCALSDLDALIDMGLHDRHGPYMTVPGLLAHCRTGQLAALAAPTALFVGLGLKDWSSPPEAVERLRTDLDPAYHAATQALEYHIDPESGHAETPAMRAAAQAFLVKWLSPRR